MAKKLKLDPILVCLVQSWASKFFQCVLSLLDVNHCCNLSMYAISRKYNKPNLPPHPPPPPQFFSWVLPLDVRHCSKLSLHASSKKLMDQTWENSKNLVLGPILASLAQIRVANVFFQNLYQPFDIMVSYHHVQYQKN